jgi:hypothetical protein
MIRIYFILAAFLCAWHGPAYGYIDPGSGSAIMSAIIGFFVAAGMLIKTYWYKLKAFFLPKTPSQDITSSTGTADDQDSLR